MRSSPRNASIRLAADRPLAFRGARGFRLECTEGRVWLTVEGQGGDFFLARGERLGIESDGLALVEGFPSGTIRLLSGAPWTSLLASWCNRRSVLPSMNLRKIADRCGCRGLWPRSDSGAASSESERRSQFGVG